MPTPTSPHDPNHRVSTSGDVEVATYLEIAEEREGARPEGSPRLEQPQESVVILDFGSQFSMLIARRVRECNVYCELLPHDAPRAAIEALNPKGFILSGGPNSVYEEGAPVAPEYVFESGLPVLGICYGMQLLVHQLGGRVGASGGREFGHAVIHRAANGASPILEGLPDSMQVWMSHGDRIEELPPGFSALATSEGSPYAVMSNDAGYIGLQFHPEVVHTSHGKQLIENFLYKVCGCAGDWTPGHFIDEAVARIKREVGSDRVLCALSGGVDSAVAAALVHKAVGDQLTCVFVDNGLLRHEEPERVVATFQRHMQMRLVHVDAASKFLEELAAVIDPEEKRKRVGETFIRVFEETVGSEALGSPLPRGEGQGVRAGDFQWLVQGTTYPDVIESAPSGTGESKTAVKIKSHHNVGGLPEHMTFRLLEPLRYLFKDEVRQVGLALGLSEEIVYRQPFPGPGLAIRVIGEVTREKLDTLRAADWIVMDEIKNAKLYRELWQSFAILTDTKSVGVMGDYRTYGYVVAVRAVTAEDAMTADWARLPHDLLGRIANRIVNEVPAVNRVVYDITSKPPGTIEWE